MAFKRRRYRRKAKTLKTTVKAIVKKQLSKKFELKYWDVLESLSVTHTPTIAHGDLISLSEPTQGQGDTQRIGDKMIPKNLRINFYMDNNGVTSQLRIIVFRTSLITPDPLDLLQVIGGTGYGPLSPYLFDKRDLFDILYDSKSMPLNPTDQVTRTKYVYIKLGEKQVAFQGATTAGINKIWLMMISDRAVTGTCPSVQFYSRLQFTDA